MRSSILKTVILAVLALAVLAGGSATPAAPGATAPAAATAPAGNPAAQTVEAYLKAMIAKDSTRLTTLSCKDWEMQALLEMDGFQAVKAELEGLACSATGTDGAATLVNCKGNIAATYGNEVQKISLERQTYKVQQVGGEWRVCGYK
jgi:hypothetical protein